MAANGFSAEIRRVADIDKRLALFLSLAFLFVWVVAVNMGLQELAPRWFQRQFDWLVSEDIPRIFLSMAIAALLAAAGFWLFSGHGDMVFNVDEQGIDAKGLFGSHVYRWADFEMLEREVSAINLQILPSARVAFGPAKLVFDISKIDITGQRLEALIVHYRPDLYSTRHVARADAPKNRSLADAGKAASSQTSNVLSDRLSKLR